MTGQRGINGNRPASESISQLGQSPLNSMRAYEVRFRTYFDRRAPLVVHVEPHREAVTKTPVPGHALRALHSGRGRSLRKQAGGYGLSPTNSPSSREIIASPDPSGKSLRFIRRCARLSQASCEKYSSSVFRKDVIISPHPVANKRGVATVTTLEAGSGGRAGLA